MICIVLTIIFQFFELRTFFCVGVDAKRGEMQIGLVVVFDVDYF